MEFMQYKTSDYHQILEEICQEESIKLTWLSSDWLGQLEKSGQYRYILGHKFDLNSGAALQVADDKYATFEVLRKSGVPIINHQILYEAQNHETYVQGRNSLAYVMDFFNQHQQHIVLKPNVGQCGHNVYQITQSEQIAPALKKIFHQSMSASMCPFYEIKHEYRVILLDEEARLVYQKTRGKDWRFNLSQGATAQPVQDQLFQQCLVCLAQKAAKALNLRFCSVDIIDTVQHELLIMEVNSGVMTSGYLEQHPEQYADVEAMYHDAIVKMFEA